MRDPLRRIPSEPYPELPLVLERFVAGIQNALQENFIGAYLVGSIATGDFDLDSDIDFVVITNNEINDAEVRLAQEWHQEIYNLGCYPAQHLEGSYISRCILNRSDVVGLQPLWFVDNGNPLLTRSPHDNRWHVRWVLRERAISLEGPDPQTLVQPVPVETLRAEMRASIEDLRLRFLAELDRPLGYLNTRFGQSFSVLTCCRMLHTFKTGSVESKRYAANWAEQVVGNEWHDLIRKAWTEREGVRFGVKIKHLSGSELLKRTAQFIAHVQDKLES
ncbi:MAG TPA: aminoglycoside adenylyltransferase domain-containing protein [Candidatus Sulfotelmatobacter sp.]|nr:aminoglycoside adenylyltransferase domain-containing protein [Candidatus Sulfotelmatobacter sp.]